MNNRLLKSGLAAGVALFVMGFLIWGFALAGFFEAHVGSATGVMKDPPDFLFIVLASLLQGIFLALVLGWKGVASAGDGMKAGAMLGVLMALGLNTLFFGTTNLMDMTGSLVDALMVGVQWGIAGAAVGMVSGSSTDA